MKFLAPAVALTAVLLTLPAHAQRGVNLQARTAGDLAELCAANPKEPSGDARINFCRGFTQGAVDGTPPLRGQEAVLLSQPIADPRSATLTEFVGWVRSMPEHKSLNAVDGFFQFLGERFPCK